MSQARAMFQSQLREAVRTAHAPKPAMWAAPRPPDAPLRRTVLRLWLPLTPLWVILAPFALLAAPLMLLAPRMRGARPFRAAFAVGRVLLAVSGTVVDVNTRDALVKIRII